MPCSGYVYVPPIWMGFSVHLNKGPFFGRFSVNMGGFFRDWQKIVKMGSLPSKFIIKMGMTNLVPRAFCHIGKEMIPV